MPTMVAWRGCALVVDDLCLIYKSSCSDAMATAYPNEKHSHHGLQVVSLKPKSSFVGTFDPNDYQVSYASKQARDDAFDLIVGPGTNCAVEQRLIFCGSLVVRAAAVRMVHQCYQTLDQAEQHVLNQQREAGEQPEEEEEDGQFCLRFYWHGLNESTLVKYWSESERDRDAEVLFTELKAH